MHCFRNSGFVVVASASLAAAALAGCGKNEHTPTTAERLKSVEVRQQTEPDSYLPRKSVDYMADIKNLKDSPEKAKAAQPETAPASTPATATASAPANVPASAPANVPANAPPRAAETKAAPVAASPAPVTPPSVQAPVAEPAKKVEAAAEAGAASQNAYFSNLRSYLAGIKRYPTSREARQQRPAGTVKVWLELTRDGKFKDAGVEQSSNSLILDQAALSTVRQGNYPAFPADAWAGQAARRFSFSLEYSLSE